MGETITASLAEARASEARRVLEIVQKYEEDYIRGDRIDTIDHIRNPFKGTGPNYSLVVELLPDIRNLIILSGKSIKFGTRDRLPFLRGIQLEIASSDPHTVGLRFTGSDRSGSSKPFLTDVSGFETARKRYSADRIPGAAGAIRAFGELSALDLLGKIKDFATQQTKGNVPRIPVPGSSGGGLPWA